MIHAISLSAGIMGPEKSDPPMIKKKKFPDAKITAQNLEKRFPLRKKLA
jgi:hypothetical protein